MSDLRDLVAHAGANEVSYEDPNLPGRPLQLYSARPAQCDAMTPVLFVHHGVNRNGDEYRDFWLPLVDAARVLVIVPNFSKEAFPGSAWYNYGNRVNHEHQPNPRNQWTYGVDGRLFSALRAAGVTQRASHGVFGHSAGGQFVHRMISLGFRDGVACAVTANAGSYAMPTLDIAFPFGLAETGVTPADLRALLQFPLTIMAGTEDIDINDKNLPREPQAIAQGPMRYARAHKYLATARQSAEGLGVACAWSLYDVSGVGHDGRGMSAAAAPLIGAALHAAA